MGQEWARDRQDRVVIIIHLKGVPDHNMHVRIAPGPFPGDFALVNGVPKVMNLKEMLICYINHQKEIIRRRTEFDLRRAKEREHILEGLKIAIDFIDEVISLIRNSKNVQDA